MTKQRDSGWFADCCLEDPSAPLTHTLGYALRGLLEAYTYFREPAFLVSCTLAADGLAKALRSEATGIFPGGFAPTGPRL
jgi:hypothetical protein